MRGTDSRKTTKDYSDSKKSARHNILIADDNFDIVINFEMILKETGFNVESFTDPLDVLRNFKPYYYDLALLDTKMPGMNGFELYNALRILDDRIKVCFITAFESYYQSIKEQFNLDATCFIRKPVSRDILVMHVVNQLIVTK